MVVYDEKQESYMKKKVIAVVSILLILIAAITMAVVFQMKQTDNNEKAKESSIAVPLIQVFYGKEVVGKIEGYTMDMKENHMRDVIIPIAADHSVPLKIAVNDNEIKSISYELKDLEEDKLIDNGEIKK